MIELGRGMIFPDRYDRDQPDGPDECDECEGTGVVSIAAHSDNLTTNTARCPACGGTGQVG